MAKTPRTRHSNTRREPVTIDLEADSVERASGEAAAGPDQVAAAEAESSTPPAGETPADAQGPAPAAEDGSEREETAARREEADPDTETSQAGAKPVGEEKSRGRAGTIALALVAGLVGGAVAAGGLQFADRMQGIGADPQPNPAVLELRQQVETMAGEIAQLRETASAGRSGQDLEQALAEPRQQISELSQSVAALQEAVSSGGAGENAALQALDSRIADLEERLTALSEAGAQAGNGEAAEQTAALASDVQGVREAADAARQAANTNAGQLQALTERFQALAERVESQDEGPRLALVVAASALQAAVERGEPFARELETYSALASDGQGLAELRQYADTGIPSRAELADEAPQAASRIAASVSSVPEGAGVIDRLMASARSVVTVRPVGEIEGEGPEAIAARMEAAVQRGDYAQALAEYESLQPEAQEAASAFADKLRARQAADRILEETLSSVLKPA